MYEIPKEALIKMLPGFRSLKLNKTKLPVLQHLKVEVSRGRVRFSGSNLDDALRCSLETSKASLESRPLLVPLATLQDAAKAADKKSAVTIEPGRVRIRIGESEMARSFEEMDVAEFPAWDGDRCDRELALPPAVIEAIGEARIAVSTDPNRWVLRGVHLAESTVVATNGRRLYVRNLDRASRLNGLGEGGIIVPAGNVFGHFNADHPARMQLIREGKDKEAEPTYRRFVMTQGAWSWSGKLIDGRYPNWRQVVPKEGSLVTRVTFSDEDADRLREVLPKMPEDKDSHAPVNLWVEGGRVLVSAGRGKSASSLMVTKSRVDGPAVTSRFNRQFLTDALTQGFRQIAFRDELSPVFMEDKKKGRIQLWMPLAPPEPGKRTVPQKEASQQETPAPGSSAKTQPVNGTSKPTTSTNERKPAPMADTGNSNPPDRTGTNGRNGNGGNPHAHASSEDPSARVRDAVARLRDLVKEVHGTVQEVSTALREADREKKALEKEHQSLRRNLKGLQSLEL